MSLPLQDVLKGKYEILEKVGEGGIGAVYKVRHRLLEEVRVIKVLRPEAASKEDLRERFLHEARMAIRLKHPNIAQLHDFSIAEDGRAYIVMEFIDGVALDAMLEASGPPSVDLALEISRQGLMALHYLHENDFVHRDVSPDNMMLTSAFDGRPLVKLIDLGIARHLGAEVRLTSTGVFLGKARYCSPEQFSAGGEHATEVDRRGDIYSCGVMLYELLTGVYPMHGDNFAELAGSHLFHPPKPFDETDPEGRLPEGLRQAILKAMGKTPEDRWPTAAEFAAELDRYRDPEKPLRDEFDRTVEIATTAMPRLPGAKRPGSTQDRLNAQFGAETTPPPGSPSTVGDAGETVMAAPRKSLADYVQEIEGLVARGKRARAKRALDKAMADHGTAEPLIELQAAVGRLAATGGEGRKLPLAGLVAAAALLLVATALGAWWWFGREPRVERPAESTTADAREMLVPRTPRWDPEAGGGEPSPFDRAGVEPPPIETEGETAAGGGRPAPGAGPPPGPRGGPGPPRPRPDGGPPPEGAPPPGPQGPVEGRPGGPPPPPPPEVSEEIFQLGAVGVVPPVLVELPPPVEPEGGRRLRDELIVVVRVLVEPDGSVGRALISEGPTFRRKYRDAALEAAERARFRPARRGNTLGRMWTEVRVRFTPE